MEETHKQVISLGILSTVPLEFEVWTSGRDFSSLSHDKKYKDHKEKFVPCRASNEKDLTSGWLVLYQDKVRAHMTLVIYYILHILCKYF